MPSTVAFYSTLSRLKHDVVQPCGLILRRALAEKLNAKRFEPCTAPNCLSDSTASISVVKKIFAVPLYHTCNSTAF